MKDQKETIEEVYIRTLLSRNIKRLRSISKYSQMNLADEAGLAHNFINDIENGKKWISPKTLAKLSTALKADPYQFFLSESKYSDQGAEIFSLYLTDFEDSFDKLVDEYRERFLPADVDDREPESNTEN